MKQVSSEENLEQPKTVSQKPQPNKTTSGLKEVNPVNLFVDMLKSALGPTKTGEALEERRREEAQQVQKGVSKEQEALKQEILKAKQPKGNIELINPPKPKESPKPPVYITGKPGYHPEEDAKKQEKEKQKMPELTVPPSKPRRGDLFGVGRKRRGVEDKSGYIG